jgi:DNA (cytosine-5)-methyltransferase 1
MMGDPDFATDVRHRLYREYLKIIIDHAPPVFVMENVKGLLSSKIDGELVEMIVDRDAVSPGVENGLLAHWAFLWPLA